MDFQDLEAELVAQLKDQLGPSIHVQAWPDNPETFDFSQPNGAVLVRFNADTYSTPIPNRAGKIIQERTAEWGVVVLHKNLSKHAGIYPLLETVRKAVTGFTFPSDPESTVLYPLRSGFIGRQPSKWIYQIIFGQTAPEVES